MDVQNQPWPKNFQEPGDLLGKSDDNPKTRWMSVNELVNGDSTSNKWGWRRSSRFLGMGGFVSDGDWAGLNHWIRMFYMVLPIFSGLCPSVPYKKTRYIWHPVSLYFETKPYWSFLMFTG